MIGIHVSPKRRSRKPPGVGQSDSTPPAIANLLIEEAQQRFSFVSTEGGACHWLLDNTANYADAASLVSAKSAGEASGADLALNGTNIGGFDPTGIAAGVWRLHVGVIDAAGNASNVLSGDLSIISEGLELNGDPLEWNGDRLIFNAA